jgi:hypothetical protein
MNIDQSVFGIDPNKLADEWVVHSQRIFEYSMEAANARMRYEEAKRRDEIIRADVSLAVRKNPEAFGLSKLTEGLIDAIVTTEESVKESVERVIECKNELDVLTAAVTALEVKKKGLECLVQLHLSAYYASPNDSKVMNTGIGLKAKGDYKQIS